MKEQLVNLPFNLITIPTITYHKLIFNGNVQSTLIQTQVILQISRFNTLAESSLHVVIPEGQSSASFEVQAIQDNLAKPQQEIDFKLLRDRTELLDVSIPSDNTVNAQKVMIKLDETSTRESLVLSSDASNNVHDSEEANTESSSVENSLELELSA